MSVKIEKQEGRNRKIYEVYTVDDIRDLILSQLDFIRQGAFRDGFVHTGGETAAGIGKVIGITTETLLGEEYTTVEAELYSAMEAGIDYLIFNPIDNTIYAITPTINVQAGEVTIPIESQTIKAPTGSFIIQQGQQTEAENRRFRERISELNENLLDLNENILPELETNLNTLEGYLADPSTIPAEWEFFEGILTNEIWADTGVFMTVWADNVFTNNVMADRVTANIIDVDDLAANEAFIGSLFAQEIVLILNTDPDPAIGGLIRSSNFDGELSPSNFIDTPGNSGWAIDYAGQSVFHNGYFRGTVVVEGGDSNVPTNDEFNTEITNVTNEANIEDLRSLKEEVVTRKVSVDSVFTNLNDNPDLTNPEKDALVSAKNSFDSEHSELITLLDNIIASGEVTSTDRTNINNRLGTYRTAFGNFLDAVEDAQSKVAQEKADRAEENANDYSDLQVETSQNQFAQNLGYDDYAQLVSEASAGRTIIDGGFLKTELIETENLFAQNIGVLGVLQGNFDGDFDANNNIETVGTQGWAIDGTGFAVFHNIHIREGGNVGFTDDGWIGKSRASFQEHASSTISWYRDNIYDPNFSSRTFAGGIAAMGSASVPAVSLGLYLRSEHTHITNAQNQIKFQIGDITNPELESGETKFSITQNSIGTDNDFIYKGTLLEDMISDEGASTWAEISNKPFSTLNADFNVVSDELRLSNRSFAINANGGLDGGGTANLGGSLSLEVDSTVARTNKTNETFTNNITASDFILD